ncbi:MAG: hypothetical protein FJ109_19225, partial [Deltaproteobacteria bacterium]|nr:hypothetical protein [Deltaproteobacteria bacterium]
MRRLVYLFAGVLAAGLWLGGEKEPAVVVALLAVGGLALGSMAARARKKQELGAGGLGAGGACPTKPLAVARAVG